MTWTDHFTEHPMTPFQVVILMVCLSGLFLSLHFVYTHLRFFYGVDYHMFHSWQALYLKSGVFYPKDTVFFNVPLAVVAFGPWAFLPVGPAVFMKALQTFCLVVLAIWLVFRIRPGHLQSGELGRFAVVLIGLAFGLTQMYYLNIYAEVAVCLLLSLFFLDRGRPWAAAFFFSLAVVFKVFLLPLILASLITRRLGLFARICGSLAMLGLMSLLLFGWDTHLEMLRAMTAGYMKMRAHGIGFPVVMDSFAGWQDLFNKLVRARLISGTMVMPLTLTMAVLYGCLAVYMIFLMLRTVWGRVGDMDDYLQVFGSLLVVTLGFNFRFDHGLLLLAAVFVFEGFDRKQQGRLTVVLFILILSRYLLERMFSGLGADGFSGPVFSFFQVVSFQFIGINSLVLCVVGYWAGLLRREVLP